MRQAEVVIGLVEGQLLMEAFFSFAQRHHAPPYRGDMLTDGEVHTLNEGRIDVLALRGEDLLDSSQRAKDDTMADAGEASTPVRIHHLRVEELWQGHPAGPGRGAHRLAARWLHPLLEMGQQRRGVCLEAIRHEQWHAIGC